MAAAAFHNLRERRAGYALFELLLACLLLALLAGAAPAGLAGLVRRRTLKTEAARLQEALERAGIESVRAGTTVEFRFAASGYSMQRSTDEQPYLRRGPLPKVTFRVAPPEVPVRFYPSGAATPAAITVAYESSSCRLVLSLRGRIRNSCGGPA